MSVSDREVAEGLRRRIRDGEWAAGEALPAAEELGRRWGAGAAEVRSALAALTAEGWVGPDAAGGVVVRAPRRAVVRSNERHQWEKDRARQPREVRAGTGVTERDTGLTMDELVFTARYHEAVADAELAEAFGVPEGTALVERVYRTRYGRESAPFNLTSSFLVRGWVAANPALLDETREPWPGGTQHQLDTVGIELDRIVEEVTGVGPAFRAEADELGLAPGAPVIRLCQRSLATDGRTVELSRITLPADRTRLRFVTRLDRW
ncbi:GntR family transcriptional regulator [Streptomyces sp. 3MP-14]|uniref:GntR family transcriptional regulator n=1 Tax=Streptomyces mimosae TaxID=2586635 RepID=A0A5N6A700_9ACTN|nr:MULTISPECIES: GntR family transcriptional regulator [Streptomyces]KAB8163709.1 GntR family transcriptional regulator [Streptomyces mimosae]KAB8175152.1 GntR family transcriptional regulator [Streptomyces sp. 3MP-14]